MIDIDDEYQMFSLLLIPAAYKRIKIQYAVGVWSNLVIEMIQKMQREIQNYSLLH